MNCGGGGGLSFGGGRKTFRDKKSTGVGDFFSWGKKGGGGLPHPTEQEKLW